jgi:hypothetical protein
MALDLSPYTSVQTNIFVKLDIPNYQVLTFSDYHKVFTIGGLQYVGLGQLLSISNTTSNLRASREELVIGISGIPEGNIGDILNSKVKGSRLTVYRAFFDPITGDLLNISGNPAGKFQGVINNFNISDDLEMGEDLGTITLTLSATSVVDLLNNKVAGRRTNPIDQSALYPGDQSFDRIPALIKSNFNFGAPK